MVKITAAVRKQPGEPVCSVSGIDVCVGDKQLLHSISLELRAGEVLALLGPNGAGKSTLLSAISGELETSSGSIEFLDKPLGDWGLKALSRLRSVLLQEHQLMFPFSTVEVVEMGRAPWHRTPAEEEDAEAIQEAIATADVTHLHSRRVPTLSGGERARVSFARVLAGRTGVVMLDEPTAALDLKHQEAVLQTVRELAAAGAAVLVVIHDLTLAAAYADRVTLLKQGRIAATGTPAEVLTTETVSAIYDTPVEVIKNPRNGDLLVLPLRG